MNSAERVMAAIEFKRPDRLPRWDNFDIFGNFSTRWQAWKKVGREVQPVDYYGIDIELLMADEGPFFRQSEVMSREGEYETFRDGWGRTVRRKLNDGYFMETVETLLDEKANLDRLIFDDPAAEDRYRDYVRDVDACRKAGRLAFSKIGGIYCRSQFMRREDRLLMDMAMDEDFCHALFGRVAEYLTQIALEELRRTNSWQTGLWVYDDSANSLAPMFSPAMWEEYFLPLYKKMIETLRSHGCRHVFFHSDGNIAPLIDGLLAAGFEGFNPLEPRCGLDLVKLRARYGQKIIFFGGMCNTRILPKGDKKEIEALVRPLAELGREGGLIIGMASIGDDISPETYDYYIHLLDKYTHY
jgi:uroporphyrinogen decarboxylase